MTSEPRESAGAQAHVETERLTLRPLTTADAEHLVALDSDPEVMRFLNGGIPTPREVIEREMLPRMLRCAACSAGYGYWAAIERASGEFIGWFGLHPHDAVRPREVELGYRLRRSAWGEGFATEGARALMRLGFASLGAQQVSATTYQDNIGSRRVMEKAGLRHVRSFRLTSADLASQTYAPAAEVWDGEDVEYALTRAEWERRERAATEGRSGDASLR